MASDIVDIVDDHESEDESTLEPPVEEGDSKLDTPEQRKLREQIAFHVAQAAKLKQELNSRNPAVSKLPPEILAEVFLCQAAFVRKERVALHATKGDDEIHQSFYKWLNVAQVCHHWREIALNCANLWTWIAFEERISVSYIRNLVKRARGLPLTVVLTINSPGLHCDSCLDPDAFYFNGSCALDFVKELLPRIRELSMFIEKDFDTDDIWESFEDPAPLLETLHVEAMPGTRFEHGNRHPATVRLPGLVFGCQTPKLRSLYVGGVRIHLSSPLFGATLRKLTIVSCQCASLRMAPDFARWQSMLRRMPELEELDVDWSVPCGSEAEAHNIVPLSNLKELRIQANLEAFAYHVKHLRFPATASIHHHYHLSILPSALPSAESQAQFSAIIAMLFQDLRAVRIAYRDHEPELLEEDLASCHCQISAIPASQRDAKPTTGTLLEDSLRIPQRPPRFAIECGSKSGIETLASSALAALDLTSVHTVDIGDFSMGNRWGHILQGARNVQVVRAHGITAFGVPAILATAVPSDSGADPVKDFHWAGFVADEGLGNEMHSGRTDEDTDVAESQQGLADPHPDNPPPDRTNDKRTALLFPNLAVLDFVDVDLEVPGDTYSPHGYGLHVATFTIMRFQAYKAQYGLCIEAILKCLRMRRTQGAADIASVRFYGCRCMDMAQLSPLVDAVPDVYWDGSRVSGVSAGEST